MLEDLFKMVKDRFNEEQKEEADSSALEIPKDLLFKCPRCQNVFYMDCLLYTSPSPRDA